MTAEGAIMNVARSKRGWAQIHLLAIGCAALLASTPVRAGESSTVFVKADEIHVGDGQVIEGGGLLIVDGIIRAVGGDVRAPSGSKTISVEGVSLTPGLIDANAMLEPDDLMSSGPRTPRQILHEIFCPLHKNNPVVGCCGSSCPQSAAHVGGQSCPQCGFPDKAPGEELALGVRGSATRAEHSSEIVPHTRVIDNVNLRSPDMGRLLSGGVTTVFVTPDSASVISSQGAIVRTGGPVLDRVVQEAGAVKAALGTDPIFRGRSNGVPFRKNVSFHSRRPTTRMGVTWVFRKAMHDTRRMEEGLTVYGADAPSPEAMKVLSRVLSGEVPFRVQAREHRDILAAIRLADEFGLSFTLEEGLESHLCLAELKAAGCPVVFGPIFDRPYGGRMRSGEANGARLHTMKSLLAAGVETALTANDLRDEDGLARQAMYAIRYGVSEADALKSVTSVPAKLLGLSDTVGTLDVGKRADIVMWRGRPFEATSAPLMVLIGGEIVVDNRGS
ncbi:MAG: amidohydrolase family protein [Planctomycetota bacterium]|jgi:imidazolonepropionase-like amidohydrolase